MTRQAVYPDAPAGTYYIVVDGNNGAYGKYTVKPTLVLPTADLTGAWTGPLTSSNGGKTVTGTLKSEQHQRLRPRPGLSPWVIIIRRRGEI